MRADCLPTRSRNPPDRRGKGLVSHQDWDIGEALAACEAYFLAATALTPKEISEIDDGDFEYPEAIALRTVALALKHGVAAPMWAAEAFLQALGRYDRFEVA